MNFEEENLEELSIEQEKEMLMGTIEEASARLEELSEEKGTIKKNSAILEELSEQDEEDIIGGANSASTIIIRQTCPRGVLKTQVGTFTARCGKALRYSGISESCGVPGKGIYGGVGDCIISNGYVYARRTNSNVKGTSRDVIVGSKGTAIIYITFK